MKTRPMKILALDTATEACSAALMLDDDIREAFQLAPREHTRLILGMCDKLLADAGLALAQLDAIAFGRGPGSFTGVRIATAAAQGLAFGAELPLVPVSTLASIAQTCYETHRSPRVLSAIDARMGGIYWGCYALLDGYMALEGEEQVSAPEAARVEGQCFGAGSGWSPYGELLQQQLSVTGTDPAIFPRAASIARLGGRDFAAGGGLDPAQAQPVYLRNKVAEKRVS